MGLLDNMLANPMTQLGLGLLANNFGHYGQFGPALGGGLNTMITMQQAQAQQKMAELARRQVENDLKRQQERERWMQGLSAVTKPRPHNAPEFFGEVPLNPDYEKQLYANGIDQQATQKALEDYMLQPGSPFVGDVLKQKLHPPTEEFGTKPFVDSAGNVWLIGKHGVMKKVDVKGRIEPGKTRDRIEGDLVIREEFDPATGQWIEIGRGPRWNPNPSTVIENYPAPTPVITPEGETKLVQFGKHGGVKETPYKPFKQEKPTDTERATVGYLKRMEAADKLLKQYEEKGYPTVGTAMAGSIPLIGGYLQREAMTPEQQMYKQAADDWIRAKLRKESGAVISEDEMQGEYETYFPQPGDTPEVIRQKAMARKQAEEQMRAMAGPALSRESQQSQIKQTSQLGPIRIQTEQDYYNLPPGAEYIAPDGTLRRKQQ